MGLIIAGVVVLIVVAGGLLALGLCRTAARADKLADEITENGVRMRS